MIYAVYRCRTTRRVNQADCCMKTAETNRAIKRKAFSSPGPEIEVLEKEIRREIFQNTVGDMIPLNYAFTICAFCYLSFFIITIIT